MMLCRSKSLCLEFQTRERGRPRPQRQRFLRRDGAWYLAGLNVAAVTSVLRTLAGEGSCIPSKEKAGKFHGNFPAFDYNESKVRVSSPILLRSLAANAS